MLTSHEQRTVRAFTTLPRAAQLEELASVIRDPWTSGPLIQALRAAVKPLSTFECCARIEGFSDEPNLTEDDILEAWQALIDTGAVWSLQGFYGRTARDLINQGICTEA